MTRGRAACAASVLVFAILVAGAPGAAALPLLQMRAEVNGRVARDRAGEQPIRLEPKHIVPLHIVVKNVGDEPADIQHVRLDGEALGLQFLTYDVNVDERIPPGRTRVLDVPLDLYDVAGQATGYLPAAISLYDGKRNKVAEQKFVVDVRGNGTSTLGIFAIALLALAILSVGTLVYKTVRRQLPRNRAVRGLQFMLAGSAVGLTLALGLPILRFTAIQPDGWIPLALGPMAIGFAIGYLAPGPLSYSIEEAREDELLDAVATQALERMTAERTAEEAARRSSETVVGASAAHAAAPATAAVGGGERGSGPAPVTTVSPGERASGPAPVTTVSPGERASGPAPVTTVSPGERASGPAPLTWVPPGDDIATPEGEEEEES
jgi:hypothetical protein